MSLFETNSSQSCVLVFLTLQNIAWLKSQDKKSGPLKLETKHWHYVDIPF
jgi:hypothetical protein